MNFVNTLSMIAHNPNCHFVSRIADVNLGVYEDALSLSRDGYRLCKCCNQTSGKLFENEDEIDAFCMRRAISYTVRGHIANIVTPHSQWNVCRGNNNRLVLYHRNTRGNTKGYHLQTDRYEDFMSILEYIDGHDKYRMRNPLPSPKKKKSPPKKGTKRYRAMERRNNQRKRRREIRNVMNLIDSLSLA